MEDYNNSKIYEITNGELYYVGATRRPLNIRLNHHKSDKKYCSSQLILKQEKPYQIKLIEDYPCNNKKELSLREGYHIKEYKLKYGEKCINKNISGRTDKEYKKDNEKHYAIMKRKWYYNNLEKVKEDNKTYRENHKEDLGKQMKKWNEQNKEYRKEYSKKYNEEHKEELFKKYSEIVDCECGGTYTHHHKARHIKTKKHLDNLVN